VSPVSMYEICNEEEDMNSYQDQLDDGDLTSEMYCKTETEGPAFQGDEETEISIADGDEEEEESEETEGDLPTLGISEGPTVVQEPLDDGENRHPVEELEGAVRFPGHDPASNLQVALGVVRIDRRKGDSIVDAEVPPLLPTSGMGESHMAAVEVRPHR